MGVGNGVHEGGGGLVYKGSDGLAMCQALRILVSSEYSLLGDWEQTIVIDRSYGVWWGVFEEIKLFVK